MRCPGQDMQYWESNAIFEVGCPGCGVLVEFFKDDVSRTCHSCGRKCFNPKLDLGCAAYCRYAEHCFVHSEVGVREEASFKEKLIEEVSSRLANEPEFPRRLDVSLQVAEKLCQQSGADPATVISCICLGFVDEKEVVSILERLKADPELISCICNVLDDKKFKGGVAQLLNDTTVLVSVLEEEEMRTEKNLSTAKNRCRTVYGQKMLDEVLSSGSKKWV